MKLFNSIIALCATTTFAFSRQKPNVLPSIVDAAGIKIPAHAATLDRMKTLLLEWRKETQDPYLDPATLAARHERVNSKAAKAVKTN